jgi:hypothetical protein
LDYLLKRRILCIPNQNILTLVEAGTCEPEGYLAEKAKGYVKVLAPGERFVAEFEIGALAGEQAEAAKEKVKALIN